MPTPRSQLSARVQHSTVTASTIGEELMITGNVTSKGEIHLEGSVQGDIHCHSLIVGDKSQIEGRVVAEEVVIWGRVIGSVHAPKVTLHSKCYVEGDVFHRGLTVKPGAFFDGMSGRCEDRLSSVQGTTSLSTAIDDPCPREPTLSEKVLVRGNY